MRAWESRPCRSGEVFRPPVEQVARKGARLPLQGPVVLPRSVSDAAARTQARGGTARFRPACSHRRVAPVSSKARRERAVPPRDSRARVDPERGKTAGPAAAGLARIHATCAGMVARNPRTRRCGDLSRTSGERRKISAASTPRRSRAGRSTPSTSNCGAPLLEERAHALLAVVLAQVPHRQRVDTVRLERMRLRAVAVNHLPRQRDRDRRAIVDEPVRQLVRLIQQLVGRHGGLEQPRANAFSGVECSAA